MTDEGLNRDIHLSHSLLLHLEATKCHKIHLKRQRRGGGGGVRKIEKLYNIFCPFAKA